MKRPLLILASASPRRRALLRKARIRFVVQASHVSEDSKEKNPLRLVKELALKKARSVARQRSFGWVLGADTVVVLAGKILGKPRDQNHAYAMLYNLAGTTHHVFTGIALVDAANGRAVSAVAKSSVRMKKLPIDQLLRLSRRHLDKAGSYAIQEKRDPIAKVVKGTYDNVVGLPVSLVKKLLRSFERGS